MKSQSNKIKKTSHWVAIPALALLAVAAASASAAHAQTTTSTTGTISSTNTSTQKEFRGPHQHLNRPELTEAQKAGMKQKRDAVDAAINAGSYSAFVTATAGSPMEGKITEAQFPKFVEAHKLMMSGNHESARTIMEELGIKGPRGGHHGDKEAKKS